MQSTFRHDRQVDRRPASFRLAEASKVFPGYVPGAVEVGVDLISARLAPEEGQCRAVAPMHMSALCCNVGWCTGDRPRPRCRLPLPPCLRQSRSLALLSGHGAKNMAIVRRFALGLV